MLSWDKWMPPELEGVLGSSAIAGIGAGGDGVGTGTCIMSCMKSFIVVIDDAIEGIVTWLGASSREQKVYRYPSLSSKLRGLRDAGKTDKSISFTQIIRIGLRI